MNDTLGKQMWNEIKVKEWMTGQAVKNRIKATGE